MIVYPNAKINLGLYVVGKRPDGYHLLETGFLPIPLCDTLEIEPGEGPEDELEVQGGIETGATADNLVLRAVRALRALHPIPPLHIRLTKVIPSGAGLGGGSADATFTLRALDELFALGLTDEELEAVALTLGADCPIFVRNVPAVGCGIGEVLTPLCLDHLEGLYLTVVKPELHIATREAFGGLRTIEPRAIPLEQTLAQPVERWRGELTNAFEDSLFPLYPELAQLKGVLYDLGATFALLTGSGAALYALSHEPLPLAGLERPGLFIWQGRL